MPNIAIINNKYIKFTANAIDYKVPYTWEKTVDEIKDTIDLLYANDCKISIQMYERFMIIMMGNILIRIYGENYCSQCNYYFITQYQDVCDDCGEIYPFS